MKAQMGPIGKQIWSSWTVFIALVFQTTQRLTTWAYTSLLLLQRKSSMLQCVRHNFGHFWNPFGPLSVLINVNTLISFCIYEMPKNWGDRFWTTCLTVGPMRAFSLSTYQPCPNAVWPDLAKFHHFGKIFKVLGNFSRAYLLFGKILNLLWQILYTFGQIFIDIHGQMLKNILAICSHCRNVPFYFFRLWLNMRREFWQSVNGVTSWSGLGRTWKYQINFKHLK